MSKRERDQRYYLRHREARLAYQRKYYATHRSQCRESVKISKQRLRERYEEERNNI